MGVLEIGNLYFSKIVKMKCFSLLFMTVTANDMEWFVDNWWEEAAKVFDYTNTNLEAFDNTLKSIPESKWNVLWDFADANKDSAVTDKEFLRFADLCSSLAGNTEDMDHYAYEFIRRYFSKVDLDSNGSLDKREYKYTIAGFAASDARVLIKAFDTDRDGILSKSELVTLTTYFGEWMTNAHWLLSPEMEAAMNSAWVDAQIDSDPTSATVEELVK